METLHQEDISDHPTEPKMDNVSDKQNVGNFYLSVKVKNYSVNTWAINLFPL